MDLSREVLEENKLTPAEEKEVYGKINAFLEKLNRELKRSNIKAEAMLGGSAAKKTFIKGDFDCDVFVKFDYCKYRKQNEKLSDYLEKALKPFQNVERVHGSRDYFQIKNKINFEVIPVLDLKDPKKALNVTDASPLHVDWVLKNIKTNPKLRDEILLAKIFCKANNVYGAESYIKGFSGHVLDILIIYYKGFANLINAASKWKPKVVIDVENYHKNPLHELNKSKTEGPLVIIDPLQPYRNAAASLSYEKFNLFASRAEEFAKSPSKEFFARKEITIGELKNKYKSQNLVVLKIKALDGKEDIVGGKLLKVFECIINAFAQNDFKLVDQGWSWDKKSDALFWFALDKKILSETKIKEGPLLKQKEHVAAFKRKNKNTFTKKNRIYAEIKRKHRKPEEIIKDIIKDGYIKERISKAVLV